MPNLFVIMVDAGEHSSLEAADAEPFLRTPASESVAPSRRLHGTWWIYGVSCLGLMLAGALLCMASPLRFAPSVRVTHLGVPEQKNSLEETMEAQLLVTSPRRSKVDSNAHDVFMSLGAGFCTDHHGKHFTGLHDGDGDKWTAADVAADGSSEECLKKCLADVHCNGYATYGKKKCGLIRYWYPSWADGKGDGHCFYRHEFIRNTTDIYSNQSAPIPKVIWTYWENMAPNGSDVVPAELPPLVSICIASWKLLNPDWDIRLLNESTKGEWLHKDDLPANYDEQRIEHKSDAVRIALLEMYGGVWMDATILLTKPLNHTLAADSNVHNFMNLATYPNQDKIHERRVNYTNYVENWFIAAPPHDPVIHRTRKCVLELQTKMIPWKPFAATGMFSVLELQEMVSLGIDTYLSMHACFLRTIGEDVALWYWYHSKRVNHIYALENGLRLSSLIGWDKSAAGEISRKFFQEFDDDVYGNLTAPGVNMVKMSGRVRRHAGHLSTHLLWCKDTTFTTLLSDMGLEKPTSCGDQSREADAK